MSLPNFLRLPALSAILLPVLLSVLLSVLAGCGEPVERFPPPCPQTVINGDSADLNRYRGAGRDLTDLVLSGRITGLNGTCTRTSSTVTTVSMTINLELTRGPAARGRAADVAYYVVVSLGDQILDKHVFGFQPQFEANSDRLRLTGDVVQLTLPVSSDRTAAAYKVSTGFQLTPEELATNRLAGPRR